MNCGLGRLYDGISLYHPLSLFNWLLHGHTFPDNTRCIRPALPDDKDYPGAELILTPPATSEPVLIDEGMVTIMLSEYKSHFPKETTKG